MDRNSVSHRLLLTAGRLAACAASFVFAIVQPVRADQLEQHNDLVNTFVTKMHADPLVADCAAHGNFIASTSTVLDHVEFPPRSFDSAHATVTPWNDSFDEGKQRVKVDTIVTVEGFGIPQNSNEAPYDLKFRCGYVGKQMLAFSWNDPVPPSKARGNAHGKSHGKGKHSSKKSTSKHATKAISGKPTHKSAAPSTHAKASTKQTTSKKKQT
ncbi:BspC domain-containing protein [Paraburkholderia adhaesiva]|uniref:BspC domain-containing protein n=1 Tax=Paraburkholderia adhaesiva TaxID=2883244 RepID=UPI001F18EFA7|nr:hypothetical protein [Paraburkholderia adhaesiva]